MIKKLTMLALAFAVLATTSIAIPANRAQALHSPDYKTQQSLQIYDSIGHLIRCYFDTFDKGVYTNGEHQSDVWRRTCWDLTTYLETNTVNMLHAMQLTAYGQPTANTYPHVLTAYGQQSEFYAAPGTSTPYAGGDANTLVALCDVLTNACGYPGLY